MPTKSRSISHSPVVWASALVIVILFTAVAYRVVTQCEPSSFQLMKYIQVQLGGCKREDLGVIKPKSPKWIIYYQYGKVATNASAFVGLEDAIKWYKENPGNDILIEGHSSSEEIDAVEANANGESIADVAQRISQLRAAAVRDYLVQRGVASGSVSSIGYGLSKPLPMHQEDFEASNRRAEILMRDKEDLRIH
ncbi:hypothetical protein SRABI111_00812 [Pseudomonas carnis]|nr:hypothetical protein SRABI08_00569 [Pseudomonas carnis]CAH0155418.1 hypothetical protein SRABI111_00812 [Pseudomonas carnis]CAH0215144.1 hypothetical protein SRABI64_02079 [Pseudomonas carnis]CAH0228089.1 hypothetical protein SRABI110_02660 [Pseudomonas carnis]